MFVKLLENENKNLKEKKKRKTGIIIYFFVYFDHKFIITSSLMKGKEKYQIKHMIDEVFFVQEVTLANASSPRSP